MKLQILLMCFVAILVAGNTTFPSSLPESGSSIPPPETSASTDDYYDTSNGTNTTEYENEYGCDDNDDYDEHYGEFGFYDDNGTYIYYDDYPSQNESMPEPV